MLASPLRPSASALILVAVGLLCLQATAPESLPPLLTGSGLAAARVQINKAFANIPLSFEVNEGQTDERVRFLSRIGGLTLFLTSDEAVFRLPDTGDRAQGSAVVRMKLLHAKRASRIVGIEPLSSQTHYLVGNDPQKWHSGIARYRKVKYE